MLPSRALAQWGWSVGVRGEYVALGGDPLASFAGGEVSGAFSRRPSSELVKLELSGRVSRHDDRFAFSDSGMPDVHRNFTEVYIRPLIQPTLFGTALVRYVGAQGGLISRTVGGWVVRGSARVG